ncbi:glycosyl transferase, group 2 family protein [Verrucomicrobiia bacterium DG1235]|nr:glycosyl transferase, group 2 family protein [Verrucomicrobiae bacterium DG1235]
MISILLPVYNAERYLEKTLQSLLAQSYAKFELIALNDGSKDGSLAILEKYAKQDNRIKIVSHPNMGLVATLNKGLELAQCELIARADADDIYFTDRLEHQYRRFQEDPTLVLLGARSIKIDEHDRILFKENQPIEKETILESLSAGFGGIIPHPVSMFKRTEAIEVGAYRPEAKHCEDLDLWLRLAEKGSVTNIPAHLVYYRTQSKSVSAVHATEQAANARYFATEWQRKNKRECPPHTFWSHSDEERRDHIWYRARTSYAQGLYASAYYQAIEGLKTTPLTMGRLKTTLVFLVRFLRNPACAKATPFERSAYNFDDAPKLHSTK